MKPTQLPSQVIPESQKGEAWMKENALAIKNFGLQDQNSIKKDVECWFMYHNIYNESEFDYLTKVSSGTGGENDYYLPAKMRHIPIQRSKINVLVAQQKYRPFQFSTTISNVDGKAQKYARRVHGFMGEVSKTITERMNNYSSQISAIEMKRQQMQAILSKEPQSEEEAMQMQAIKQQMPIIEQQLNTAKQVISTEQLIVDKDLVKINNYYKYDKEDIVEDTVKKLTLKLRQDLHIERKSVKNFVSEVVTGKQYYFVDYNDETHELEFETVNGLNVRYPKIDGVEWIQDGPWVMIENTISLNYAIDKYGLNSTEEIEKLRTSISSLDSTQFFSAEFGRDVSARSLYSGSNSITDGISERKIYWRSSKKIQVKRSPNPYDGGKVFTHFIDDEQKYFQEGQLYWDNKKKVYVDKKSGNEYQKKDVILSNKGEKLETRYIDEVYEATILGDDVFKRMRKKPTRLYSNDNYSWTSLPLFGKTFNSITERPYSLIWDTKDIQKLYNILNYHRELLLATSGVKGTIMDISQKPEGMDKKEWLYYKKLGTQWIETIKKHGRPMSFNQFGSYDDTMSASVQYIDNMMLMLDDVLGNIIGVGRQRQGQVSASDQVATYQMAINQNSLITEMIYAEHDEIERRAVEALVNYAIKYKYMDGGDFDYKTDGMGTEMFKIPPQMFDEIDIQVGVANNTIDEQKLKELKQFAIKEYDKGVLPFKDMIALYDTSTLIDMRKKFEIFTEEAFDVAQRNAENTANIDIQKEERLIQAKAEVDMQAKKMDIQLKQLELQLKGQIEQTKNQTANSKIISDKEKHSAEMQLRMGEIQNENIIEQQYIDEQKRSNIVGERLSSIELQLKTLLDNANLGIDKQKAGIGNRHQKVSDR